MKTRLEMRIKDYQRWLKAIKAKLTAMAPDTVCVVYRCLVHKQNMSPSKYEYILCRDNQALNFKQSYLTHNGAAEIVTMAYARTLWKEETVNEVTAALQNPTAPDDWEWDVEVIESDIDVDGSEIGDIVDHMFQDTYADCIREVENFDYENGKYRTEIVLTTRDDTGAKSYAYLQPNGKLPRKTDCGVKVPKFFHDEIKAYIFGAKSVALKPGPNTAEIPVNPENP